MSRVSPAALAAGLVLASAACSTASELPEHCVQRDTHRIPTADGASVALHRYRGDGPPVLVVHGISSNSSCWDLAEDRSIGLYLQDRGFDTWLLDLRGHGASTTDAQGERQRTGWSIDSYGQQDLPAAMAYVREQSGADRVAYVGHSLGGMVGAIYAGTVPGAQDQLSALIVVGSPMDFTDPDPLLDFALGLSAVGGRLVPVLDSERYAALPLLMPRPAEPIDDLLFNDMSPEARRLMYQHIVSPMTAGEMAQLAHTHETGHFMDAAGEVDYTEALAAIQVPTLVIAGRADHIAPVDRVIAYYRRVSSPEKRLVIAGRSTGFVADYGHIDLTAGDHAREEIFPIIADWVDR